LPKIRSRSPIVLPIAAAAAIAIAFVILNIGAYDGFFQDDELDNLSWAPVLPARDFLVGFLKPTFDITNFRPTGSLYFALVGRGFGLNFAPWITPIFVFHLLNGLLLFLLMRKLAIERWSAIAGAAFFTLSAAAFDVYWKPMYIFDLLAATFSLACVLSWAHRRWVLSFVSFWLAYKAKEIAVLLPAVLAIYEYWFGERRFRILIPFALASLNFGIQGILRNPNHNNDYTMHFTPGALGRTVPFYAHRFLMFRGSGLLLGLLIFLRDRRIWFGLAGIVLTMVPLFVLPGRLFEAYVYLPLTFAAIALAAAGARWNPVWAWVALALWMPFNVRQIHRESRATLAADDQAFSFVDTMEKWVARRPEPGIFVYDGAPAGFHHWGITAAWNIVHHASGLRALFADWPEGRKALAEESVAFGAWDGKKNELRIYDRPRPSQPK
jgi:hypothetical protein